MPETFIIYREKYRHNLAEEWRGKFHPLNALDSLEAKSIKHNTFTDRKIESTSSNVYEVLEYYLIERERLS